MTRWQVALLFPVATGVGCVLSGTCHETDAGYVPTGPAVTSTEPCLPAGTGDSGADSTSTCAFTCEADMGWCAGVERATTCERIADLEAWEWASGTNAYLDVGQEGCFFSCGAK